MRLNELKAELVRQGKTVSDLANAIGKDRSTASMKLNGHRSFTDKEKIKVMDYLGLEYSEMAKIFLPKRLS